MFNPLRPNPAAISSQRRTHQRVKLGLSVTAVAMIGLLGMVLLTSGRNHNILDIDVPWMRDKLMVAVAPVLNGASNDGEKYQLTAQEAAHSIASTRYIYLSLPEGSITRTNGRDLFISAPKGTLDTKKNTLEADGPVIINSGDKFNGEFGHALIDFSSGVLKASKSVALNIDGQSLLSERAEFSNQGDSMNFFGKVRVYFPPPGGSWGE